MNITHLKNNNVWLSVKNFWIRLTYRAGNDPYTDWAVIFTVNTLLVITFVAVGIWVYFDSTGKFKNQSVDASAGVTSSRKTNVSIQAFTNLVKDFETKKITEEAVAVSVVSTPDPSKP